MRYFLDTYAMVEIINGNKNYFKYLNDELFTSIINLYELYYNLLKEKGKEIAKSYFMQYKDFIVKYTDEDIFEASEFKLKNRKNNISYADALGYSISLSNNMIFLTGDKEFKGLHNVEFVK